jgi:hypothetical protein
MGRFIVFSIRAVTFNLKNPSIIPAYPLTIFHRHVELILIFLEDPQNLKEDLVEKTKIIFYLCDRREPNKRTMKHRYIKRR